MIKNKKNGFSMIEILIATGVVGLVMTAVAAGLVLSIKNTAISRYRTQATIRAQEAMEVFRRERTLLGWTQFYESLSSGTYCLEGLPQDSIEFASMSLGACDGAVIDGTVFEREAVVSIISADEIRVEIEINWQDSDIVRSTTIVQEFRRYENL